MSAFSNYYENKIIDHMIRGEVFAPPISVYIALFTAEDGLEENSPTAEVVGGNYTRQKVILTPANEGATHNLADVIWNAATSNWGLITHAALVDHPTNTNWGTGVNILMWNNISVPKDVYTEDIFKILTTKFNITIQ